MFKELGGMMSLLGNKGKLQEEAQKFQTFVSQLVCEGNAGGGMVTATVNGKMELLSINITPEAYAENDREMLEDLIVGATNHALTKAREQIQTKTQEMAASMGLPAGMMQGLPGLGG